MSPWHDIILDEDNSDRIFVWDPIPSTPCPDCGAPIFADEAECQSAACKPSKFATYDRRVA